MGTVVLMKTVVIGMFPEKLAELTRLLSTEVWKIKSHHFMSELSDSFINSHRKNKTNKTKILCAVKSVSTQSIVRHSDHFMEIKIYRHSLPLVNEIIK